MKEPTKTLIQNYSIIIGIIAFVVIMCIWLGVAGFVLSLFFLAGAFILFGAISMSIAEKKHHYDLGPLDDKTIEEVHRTKTENFNVQNLAKNEAYTSGNLHMELYYPEDRNAIECFLAKYDLSSVESILNIPVPNYKRQPLDTNVPTEPEQILQRQATYYKKAGRMDLAIACLKKSNEFMKTSFYKYQIDSYMRLVDFLYYNSQFEEAKKERKSIDEYFNYKNEVDVLTDLMNTLPTLGEREAYYKRLIEPAKKKLHDKNDYYWILENLPNDAPKSFSAYRRMKKANTEKYKKLVSLALDKEYILQ